MKKVYLLAIISIAFISCTKDDATENNQTSKKKEVFNFSSYENMDAKIDEISQLKSDLEKSTVKKYTSKITNNSNIKYSESDILQSLKNYHNDRIIDIYKLRKKINFVSIQSIADEINSLTLLDPNEANRLLTKYKALLWQDKYEIKTVFEDETGNVINENGEILINERPVDFKISKSNNQTAKYVGDEYIRTGTAAVSNDFFFKVDFFAGREKHKDTFGRTFFRYYTEFKAYYINFNTGVASLCPSSFNVDSSSIAGFSQTGSMPFSDFAFSMPYPSGNGSSIRNVGGQIWTAYQPEGGFIKGTFTGAGRVATCNFKYTR